MHHHGNPSGKTWLDLKKVLIGFGGKIQNVKLTRLGRAEGQLQGRQAGGAAGKSERVVIVKHDVM